MANKVKISGVDTAKLPKLKNSDLEALMIKLKQGDQFAREQFVIANMRLVLSIVQRFSVKNGKADDMFQVGCVGLIKAIDNFDTTLGLKFSTYAVPMIIGEIRRYLRDGNSIRVSRSLRDIAYKALLAGDKIAKESNKEATIDEISKELELSPSEVSMALDAISDTISLSEPVYNDGSETIRVMDQISDEKNDSEALYEKFALSSAIAKLSAKEKQILDMRYFEGKTQMEVSSEIGISQAQVSRLEKCALESIKKEMI